MVRGYRTEVERGAAEHAPARCIAWLWRF